jgi:hypothetical protein
MTSNLTIKKKMTTTYSCKIREKILKTYTSDNLAIMLKVMTTLTRTKGTMTTSPTRSQVSLELKPKPSPEGLMVTTQCKEDMKRASHNLKLTSSTFLKSIKTRQSEATKD